VSELNGMMKGKQGHELQFSSTSEAGGHIVNEWGKYRGRDTENSELVECLKERIVWREGPGEGGHRENRVKYDKSLNPLTALPASPGSGKSTFLVHFPASPEWAKFAPNAIVSTLSWNSAMTGGPVSFPLRIIYGAMRAMQLVDSELTWLQWSKRITDIFPHVLEMTASEAVAVLRSVFGGDRPVLLIVDELSKTTKPPYVNHDEVKNDDVIMAACGALLDESSNNHIVVSALAPSYILDLLTGSQRDIRYHIISMLLDLEEPLGAAEVHEWATKLLKTEDVTSTFVTNVLLSAHLLASGHPRTVERFVKIFVFRYSDKRNQNILALTPNTLTVLKSLASGMARVAGNFGNSSPDIFEIAMSTKPIDIQDANDPRVQTLRRALDLGHLILFPHGHHMFLAGLPAFAFLHNFGNLPDTKLPLCTAASALFNTAEMSDIADLFERSVDMTIFSNSEQPSTLQKIFGIDSAHLPAFDNKMLTLRARGHSDKGHTWAAPSELFVPCPLHLGYDSRVRSSDLWFYIQVKIAPSNTLASTVYAKTITRVLQEHLQYHTTDAEHLGPKLADVHILVYDWGDDGSKRPSLEGVIGALAEVLGVSLEEQLQVNNYVKEQFATNVHTVTRPKIDEWLIPSLRVFPRIVMAVSPS
jgi:hypothetical protein